MSFRNKKQPVRKSVTQTRSNVRSSYYHNARDQRDVNLNRQLGPKKTTKHIKKAKKIWLEKFGLIVLTVVVIVCFFSILYLSSSANVEVVGSNPDSLFIGAKEQVLQRADQLLKSSFLDNNKLTVDTDKVSFTLSQEFPMYSNIAITLPLIDHHPTIYLTPAEPAFSVADSAGQYLINDNGQIMFSSYQNTSFNRFGLSEIIYPSSQYLTVGQQLLTSTEVRFIDVILYELATKNIKIASISLPSGTAALNVAIANKPYYVKFNLQDNDPRQQVGEFLATQHYLVGQGITPSQYFDVRTDGRVYYQ